MFGKRGGHDRSRSRRRLDHLVLMRGGNCNALAVDDAIAGRDVIDVSSDAPAFLGLAYNTAEGLGHQLVAEAYANHRNLAGIGAAHKILQRRNPLETVVNAGRRAGDQDRLQRVGVWKRLAIDDADGLEIERLVSGAYHPLEHLRVRAVTGTTGLGDQPCFDDRDARHGVLQRLDERARFRSRQSHRGIIATVQFRGSTSPRFRGDADVGSAYAAAFCRASSALYSSNSSAIALATLGRTRIRS